MCDLTLLFGTSRLSFDSPFLSRLSFFLVVVDVFAYRNVRFTRDGEPRTSTRTLTQLLSSGVFFYLMLLPLLFGQFSVSGFQGFIELFAPGG